MQHVLWSCGQLIHRKARDQITCDDLTWIWKEDLLPLLELHWNFIYSAFMCIHSSKTRAWLPLSVAAKLEVLTLFLQLMWAQTNTNMTLCKIFGWSYRCSRWSKNQRQYKDFKSRLKAIEPLQSPYMVMCFSSIYHRLIKPQSFDVFF